MPIENIQKFVLVLLYGSLVLQSFTLLANPMNVNKKANLLSEYSCSYGPAIGFWTF